VLEADRVIHLPFLGSHINIFVIATPHGHYLVDTGLPAMWPWLLWRVHSSGVRRNTLRGVILTHNHIDHTGNAAALQAMGLELLAHRQEVPYLSGLIEMPGYGRNIFGQALEYLDSAFLAPTKLHGVRNLDSGEYVMGSRWQVVHTPGHTPGSLALWNSNTGGLITGDTLTTSWGTPQGPHPAYTADLPRAMQSAHKLLDMGPRIVYPGHGKVVAASAFERVRFELKSSPHVCGGSASSAHP